MRSELRKPDPSADEVAPGILRVMLPVEVLGLGHVNCYVLEDEDGLSLIDPGLADAVSYDTLKDRLTGIGLDVADVHTIAITHSHFDHFGGVARWVAHHPGENLRIIAHRAFGAGWNEVVDHIVSQNDDAELISTDDEEAAERIARISANMSRPTAWGALSEPFSPELLAEWSMGISIAAMLRPPTPNNPVEDADRVRIGQHEWVCMHTPGHAVDHLCLWNEELGVFFSGDHVLPTITPHVGGLNQSESPVDDLFDSLERTAQLENVTIVLPAHGDPFTDLSGRSREIRVKHEKRMDRLRDVGPELGEPSVDELVRVLYRPESWGNLPASETFSQLEYLTRRGEVTRNEQPSGLLTYKF